MAAVCGLFASIELPDGVQGTINKSYRAEVRTSPQQQPSIFDTFLQLSASSLPLFCHSEISAQQRLSSSEPL